MGDSPYVLRRATQDDFPVIRRLIRGAKINPFGLDWRRFIVAVDSGDRILGCGQLKPHGRAIIELASIFVEEGYRGEGIARQIIERLIELAPRPLYLTCRSGLRALYSRWGFREVGLPDMPPYYQRLVRVMSVAMSLARHGEHLSVMVLK